MLVREIRSLEILYVKKEAKLSSLTDTLGLRSSAHNFNEETFATQK